MTPGRKILTVLALAAALFWGYSAALTVVPSGLLRRGFGQKDNIVKVENVLFRPVPPRVLLVGSSLTALLYDYMLPPDWGNLAIGAGSSLTGLELIERSGLTPKVVVIEVNMLMHAADRTLLDEIYSEPLHSLRRRIPALQLRNHPTTLLFSLIESGKGHGTNMRSPEKYRLGMQYHTDAFTRPLGRVLLEARIQALAAAVRGLGERGATVYFVRFPVDPAIARLPQMTALQSAVQAHFTPDRFGWIAVPPDNTFVTTDGIHLDTESAQRMAKLFIETVPDR